MPANNTPYEILTGVGTLYRAPVGTAFPALTATPAAPWVTMGDTDGGVKITTDQKTKQITSDQRTGPIKAIRTEESLKVETNLKASTMENIAALLSVTVTDVAPGAGTIGTRSVALHRGSLVNESALLFRGSYQSPYGDWPAQFELPRGYYDGPVAMEYKKDGEVLLPVQFVALEDPNANSESERFGQFIVQDAAST
jgi:hypothetical protein